MQRINPARIWDQSGTYGLTLALKNVATGKAYSGTRVDWGQVVPDRIAVRWGVETGTAPTAGTLAYLYYAESDDPDSFPAGVSTTPGAYKDSEEAEWLAQLGTPVGVLVATNDANLLQQASALFIPRLRYGIPIVYQVLGQTLRNADPHLSFVRMAGVDIRGE